MVDTSVNSPLVATRSLTLAIHERERRTHTQASQLHLRAPWSILKNPGSPTAALARLKFCVTVANTSPSFAVAAGIDLFAANSDQV